MEGFVVACLRVLRKAEWAYEVRDRAVKLLGTHFCMVIAPKIEGVELDLSVRTCVVVGPKLEVVIREFTPEEKPSMAKLVRRRGSQD